MHKAILAVILLASVSGWGQWAKQGTVLGNITDVEVIQLDGSGKLIYAATEGAGVFKSTDGSTWNPVNGTGSSILPDLHIRAIASIPGFPNYLIAISEHTIYWTTNQGTTWTTMDSAGNLPKDCPFEDVAAASYSGSFYYYLATYGCGVYRRVGSGVWATYSTGFGSGDNYVISIGANTDRVLAGTTRSLYWRCVSSSTWTQYTDPGFPVPASIPAISFRQTDYALISVGMMPVGGAYGGLWYTTSWTCPTKPTFAVLNPSGDMPTNEEFISIDYFNDPTLPAYQGVAGTRDHLYQIPNPGPPSIAPSGNYAALDYRGPVAGVSVGRGTGIPLYRQVFFGGPGKGPFWVDFGATNRPTPIRSGMLDRQVSDIGASSQYSASSDWEVFAASNINGLFKNQEVFDALSGSQGYFTRMIGAPTYDGVPNVNCLVLSPVYQKGGDMGGAELTLFVGTEGTGVLKSTDGGRSWFAPDSASTKPLPVGSRVRALAISPQFASDQTVFAAVVSSISSATGVYITTDGGINWNQLTGGSLTNFNFTSLALHPLYPTTNVVYLGCGTSGAAGTVWKYDATGGWSVLCSPFTHPVTSLATAMYSGSLRVFIGTEDDGIYYFSGSGCQEYNNTFTDTRFISALKASPAFPSDSMLIATVRPIAETGSGGFCWSEFPSGVWTPANNGLPPDLRLPSVAFAPNYSSNNIIFCGHAQLGVFTTRMSPGSPPSYAWKGSAGLYTTPQMIRGLAVDPTNPEIVLAATDDMGVMISLDGGYTFRPWSKGLTWANPTGGETWTVPKTLSVTVTILTGGTTRRAVCGTGKDTPTTPGHGIYYVDYDPSASDLTNGFYYPTWTAAAFPGPAPPTFGDINELRLAGLVLMNEPFEGTWPPTGWTTTNGGGGGNNLTWTSVNPAASGCPLVPVIAPLSGKVAAMDSYCDGATATQADLLYSPNVPLNTGTTSLTLEFDHHFSWYSGSSDEHGYYYVYRPSIPGWSGLGTFHNTSDGPRHVVTDLSAYASEAYIRVRFYYVGAYDDFWAVDNVKITAEKYDMDATDTVNGRWHSNDAGAIWALDSVPPPYGLTDLFVQDTGGFPWDRGKTSFVWGVSSGLSPAFRSGSCSGTGYVWQFSPLTSTWSQCTAAGLDPCEDYRAVLETTSGSLLVGSKDLGGGSAWTGLYRSEDICATFSPSKEGLPSNPQVWALQELDNGDILGAVNGTLLGGADVYLSDASSQGRAWVRTGLSASTPTPGSIELGGGGGTVYTGLSEDGIWAQDAIIGFTGTPYAYFEVASSGCVNTAVSFHDYSAGHMTSWAWNFGDAGTSTLQNPSHTYASTGTYYPQLTVCNYPTGNCTGYPSNQDSYTLPSPGLQILPELEADIRLYKGAFFTANFEAGTEGFTATGLWHRSNDCSARSTDFYYGQDGICTFDTGVTNSGTLTSPPISLAGLGASLTLSFSYLLTTEAYGSGYDRATVEISTNGGASWTVLNQDAPNGGTLVVDGAWHAAFISLASYAGSTVLIRFTFNTVDATNNNYEGFRVDDVRLSNGATDVFALWPDTGPDTGHQVYASATAPSGSAVGSALPACTTYQCKATMPAGYVYYRLQVKASGYACADGPVGGSW
jgi:hypothetical protein